MNTPTNPTGKVFDHGKLDFFAGLIQKYDTSAICDEVYEHLIVDGVKHFPLFTLPGMAESAIRIGSAGKTFSTISWKVGFLTMAPEMLSLVAKAHQFVAFTTASNLQRTVAHGLDNEQTWHTNLAMDLQAKRDRLKGA